MCGRFVLLTDLSVIVKSFDIQEVACDYRPDHNLSPGQEIPAVIHEGRNRLVGCRWGLIPSWAKDPSIGSRMFNARAETIAEKPSFRSAFQKRRCLIPADGFYEWQKLGKVKKPLRFSLKSGEPFGFAGLHEIWISPEKNPIHTCTIITTEPNELMRPIHDRMPVILPKQCEAAWIDPDNTKPKDLLSLLKPYPPDEMIMSEVDPRLLYQPKAQAPAFLSS
jgi:putative SOS response-associated peptidase YedK